MTTHYNILGAWARALQLKLQVSSMRTKQESDGLGRGKRCFKKRKTMRYENETMKSDNPTREKYVFCNEKSRKNKLLHSQRAPSQKVFLIFAKDN